MVLGVLRVNFDIYPADYNLKILLTDDWYLNRADVWQAPPVESGPFAQKARMSIAPYPVHAGCGPGIGKQSLAKLKLWVEDCPSP